VLKGVRASRVKGACVRAVLKERACDSDRYGEQKIAQLYAPQTKILEG
jgi:hypothetical protein